MSALVVGLDIGTSSTKAVAVDADGRVVAAVRAEHGVQTPRPGWFEQDAEAVWWQEPAQMLCALLTDPAVRGRSVRAVAVSALGPCLVPCDGHGSPLRPGILYGIDARATEQIVQLDRELGTERILERGGSALSSQAVGPKLLWLQQCEPQVWAQTTRWFSASSFLVHRLTGAYVLDHHTASQYDPMYDVRTQDWARDWAEALSPGVALPELAWPHDVVGAVTPQAAETTGLPVGTPVLAGVVDAWAEAHSVGVRHDGDLMLMYGSTMFLVGVDKSATPSAGLWLTTGLARGSRTLAAGMATSGLLVDWVARITDRSVAELSGAAAAVAPGADGLVLLPYFAGERSPLFDPSARGVVVGLTLGHTPAHLMRAAYEGVAMGVRHNLEAFDAAGAERRRWRAVAVGGGTAGRLWPQIVSDVTGRVQEVPEQTIGACYGDALLAAVAAGLVDPGTDWTRVASVVTPRTELAEQYDGQYESYRELYPATRHLLDDVRRPRTVAPARPSRRDESP